MRTALACPRRKALTLGLAVLALGAAAAVLLLIVALPDQARAAPFELSGEDWEGLSGFLHTAVLELGSSRVVATSNLDLHRLDPADGVVLVHPTRALDVEELSAFMRAGGHLVLLDDYGTGDELLAKFDGRRVPLPSRPLRTLRGNAALAIAEPGTDLHKSLGDISDVVTNHATGIEQPALSPILVVRGEGGDDALLGVAGIVGRGRLLAIGDGSVLINSMLRFPGNRKLALAVVRYAVEDESWGKRSGKLYVVANDFATTGSFGQQDSPLSDATNELRRALAESLDALRHSGVSPAATYVAALAVGIGILVWTAARVGRMHTHATPRFARRVPVVAQGGIAGHAAVLGAPATSRALAILELKSALEEEIATRLGLDRAPHPEQLVARLRAARLLDESGARALSHLLATMARVETRLGKRPGGFALRREGPTDAEVLTVAAQVRDVRLRLGLEPGPV